MIAVDAWGTQWRLDVALTRNHKSSVARRVWLVRIGDDLPRFVTCWVV